MHRARRIAFLVHSVGAIIQGSVAISGASEFGEPGGGVLGHADVIEEDDVVVPLLACVVVVGAAGGDVVAEARGCVRGQQGFADFIPIKRFVVHTVVTNVQVVVHLIVHGFEQNGVILDLIREEGVGVLGEGTFPRIITKEVSTVRVVLMAGKSSLPFHLSVNGTVVVGFTVHVFFAHVVQSGQKPTTVREMVDICVGDDGLHLIMDLLGQIERRETSSAETGDEDGLGFEKTVIRKSFELVKESQHIVVTLVMKRRIVATFASTMGAHPRIRTAVVHVNSIIVMEIGVDLRAAMEDASFRILVNDFPFSRNHEFMITSFPTIPASLVAKTSAASLEAKQPIVLVIALQRLTEMPVGFASIIAQSVYTYC